MSFCFAAVAAAQPPPGYYDTVDASNPAVLRQTLHEVIDDHIRFPYTSASTDTWDILNLADEDPGNPGNIIDVYKNASYAKISGGVGAYNREHSWPKSYGFPTDGTDNYPYTDCHHLFLTDSSYNSSRSNKPYRFCSAACAEQPTEFNDGRGGGSGVYPGNSNWTTGSFTAGTWETWSGRRGDVARAIFYMDVRYEGGFHGVTGQAEPDLIVTDDELLIDASNTGANESVAYMGILSDLLQWHDQDPVDSRELHHTDAVSSFQGNRNPFVDHPEWVDCLYRGICGGPDTTPPAAPSGLAATPGDGVVGLTWNPNAEPDLAGYNVFRSTVAGGPYTQLNGVLLPTNAFTDAGVVNGTTYFYVVTAVDTSGNESGLSSEASATPQAGGGGGGTVILSEVFYDASGTDDGLEWVELFNPGTTAVDLSGFSLGNGGTDYTYSKVQLSGVILPGQTFVVGGPTSSSLNGNPSYDLVVNFNPDFQNSGTDADGVALFDLPAAQVTAATVPHDAVIYGPANGNGLIDETGVANPPEVGDAPAGSSIERADLAGTWRIQSVPTPNSAPDLAGGGGDTTPPAAPTGLTATAGDGSVSLDWLDNSEPDLDGYNVYRSTASGGPYSQINGVPVAASDYLDSGVTNGTTYFYVVTAVDTSANESADSTEASATPQAGGGGSTSMHVSGIVLTTLGGGNVRARAVVTIVDDLGNPVAGATADGTFSGDFNESQSGSTDASGVAVLTTSNRERTPVSFTFCVDGVSHASLAYDPAANAVTCTTF